MRELTCSLFGMALSFDGRPLHGEDEAAFLPPAAPPDFVFVSFGISEPRYFKGVNEGRG